MLRKELVRLLQQVKPFSTPNLHLEQYPTPPDLAATLAWIAFERGELSTFHVIDACAGTGRLGIAAALLGAQRVLFLELDPRAIQILQENLTTLRDFISTPIDILRTDVLTNVIRQRDTLVFMNPPFGIQGRLPDRLFVDRILDLARIAYIIMPSTRGLPRIIRVLSRKHSMTAKIEGKGFLSLARTYSFHTRRSYTISVDIVRFEKSS